MIDFQVDTNDLSAEFSLSRQEVDQLLELTVDNVAEQFGRLWTEEAKNGLHSSREQYVTNIFAEKRDRFTSVVYLNPAAWLPNAIEMGASEFDMKSGLLMSDKVKYDKDGDPYITVPFRHATPNALGENGAFSNKMTSDIYKSAKKLTGKQSLPLTSIDSKHHIPKNIGLRKEVKNNNFKNITKDTPMTSIYEGMQKRKGGYVTFRRVSLRSDADRWIHPGFEKRDFMNKAVQRLDVANIVDRSIDDYLSQLGF